MGIESIRDRLELDDQLIAKIFSLHGIKKGLIRNAVPVEKAKEYGLEAINGLDMLINQAAKALEIWTGKMPDVDRMKIAALESL